MPRLLKVTLKTVSVHLCFCRFLAFENDVECKSTLKDSDSQLIDVIAVLLERVPKLIS